jgi:predicted P-loop ATPase/GTPase
MTITEHMLTTVDNPFDPFTQFEEWYQFDTTSGYDTLGLLARVAKVSSELSETDQELAIERAMNEIVEENVSGMWRKVSKEKQTE